MSQRKSDEERVNRNERVFTTREIMWDGQTRGPEAEEEWHPETQKWWEWLRNSAQALLMQDSDWLILKIAAKMHSQMHSKKQVLTKDGYVEEVPITPGEMRALAAEFRTYTDTYGLTFQSRVRYGINIVTPEDVEKEATQVTLKEAPVNYRAKFGG